MIIIGSGLAGCLAGVLNQTATICEPKEEPTSHKALLRFRSPQIGESVGIPFKQITTHKGIWMDGEPVSLSPLAISLYSQKVTGKISQRSICNLEPVERYIAPDNFHEMLLEQCNGRVSYGVDIPSVLEAKERKISTLPMFVTAKHFNYDVDFGEKVRGIYVTRMKISNCNAYMTYYYPGHELNPYRASITGDTLIIESCEPIDTDDIFGVLESFGLQFETCDVEVENYEQPNGKMSKIDEATRKKVILDLTLKHGIYSLGRFAVWKNLLLDDVYNDILVIRTLLNKELYDHHLSL